MGCNDERHEKVGFLKDPRQAFEEGFRWRSPVEETPGSKLATNPKDLIGLTKVPLHLVPPAGLIHEALAMQDGAEKYGAFNWRANAVLASIYVAAALRHIYAWYDGEDVAADSGHHHLGHARACLGIILDALETDSLGDDRPDPGATSRLLERHKKEK